MGGLVQLAQVPIMRVRLDPRPERNDVETRLLELVSGFPGEGSQLLNHLRPVERLHVGGRRVVLPDISQLRQRPGEQRVLVVEGVEVQEMIELLVGRLDEVASFPGRGAGDELDLNLGLLLAGEGEVHGR